MTAAPPRPAGPGAAPPGPSPEALAATRRKVRDLLSQSASFRALPPDRQREIARHTVEVASYLVEPEGIRGDRLAPPPAGPRDPYALSLADDDATRYSQNRESYQYRTGDDTTPGQNEQAFRAQSAREGAAVAGALLNQVNFVDFVSGLIDGVFNSIVESSIQQMEAYGQLVANVAKSLNQFRDENVSVNQGRDHLVDRFPDLFQIDVDTGDDFFGDGGGGGPRVRVRDGIDEDEAVQRVNQSGLVANGAPLERLDDEVVEELLVTAARNELARNRQQLLATMVTMGINRIVVTDGKIEAKVLYDFQARDSFRTQTSATQFDYGDQYTTTREGDYERTYQGSDTKYSRDGDSSEYDRRGASSWAKGNYKSTSSPVLKLASATQSTNEGQLQTRASLAGIVEVNFKSDHIPLEKIADSMQIGMIQQAAGPGRGVAPGTTGATPPAGPAQPAPAA